MNARSYSKAAKRQRNLALVSWYQGQTPRPSLSRTAVEFGISKQRVHQLLCRLAPGVRPGPRAPVPPPTPANDQ